MSYIILGVHGLANKAEKATLEDWWHRSIIEGLKRNCGRTSNDPLNFTMVYWADVMYKNPIPDAKNDEPYYPADGNGPLITYKDGWWDTVVTKTLAGPARVLDAAKHYFGFGRLADLVLKAKLKDLARYYGKKDEREKLRGRLTEELYKYRDRRIMVIGHSMGSIVAYDVLRLLGRNGAGVTVEHFITIGSPLGLPHVKDKIYRENDLVRTPSIVKRWTNYADRRDPVALDVHLGDDYAPNDPGVKVGDDLVINGYVSKKTKRPNFHKSFGYLRAPEVSQAIRAFL